MSLYMCTCIYIYIYIYTYTCLYTHTILHMYILSGPWKRWESFRVVSIGRTRAQRKRGGNVNGNVMETLTETWKHTRTNVTTKCSREHVETHSGQCDPWARVASDVQTRRYCQNIGGHAGQHRPPGSNPRQQVTRRGRSNCAKSAVASDPLGRPRAAAPQC